MDGSEPSGLGYQDSNNVREGADRLQTPDENEDGSFGESPKGIAELNSDAAQRTGEEVPDLTPEQPDSFIAEDRRNLEQFRISGDMNADILRLFEISGLRGATPNSPALVRLLIGHREYYIATINQKSSADQALLDDSPPRRFFTYIGPLVVQAIDKIRDAYGIVERTVIEYDATHVNEKEPGKNRLFREELLRQIEAEVERTADRLGYPIDPGIKGLVVMLKAFGLSTTASCEGHLDHGSPYPWVDVGVDSYEYGASQNPTYRDFASNEVQVEAVSMQRLLNDFNLSGSGEPGCDLVIDQWTVSKARLQPARAKEIEAMPEQAKNEQMLKYRKEVGAFAHFLRERFLNPETNEEDNTAAAE